MLTLTRKIVNNPSFNHFITIVILIQATVLVLETIPYFKSYYPFLESINVAVLVVYIIEAGLKITASYPKVSNYFRNGWNILDFSIIVLSLLPLGGSYTTIARLIRLLRVTRLTNRSKEMSIVVMTIVKSIPSMVNIFLLLSLLFFIYSIAGYHLFGAIDPAHWDSLPRSVLTLFQILTLEGWVEVMSTVTQANPLNGLYFISFIVVSTFIVINIFVAVIVRKSEEAYKALEDEIRNPVTQKEILFEIKEIRKKINDLESRLSKDQG
ncbi:MAG: ion transporter [Candidatus Nitrosocosmicus sp.]|nr:ion transporter [Candidatus Nitrosocosmicus sp.]MDN5869067.1 ion transporter [Candidatus Nitrosocosmicus sp.]